MGSYLDFYVVYEVVDCCDGEEVGGVVELVDDVELVV